MKQKRDKANDGDDEEEVKSTRNANPNRTPKSTDRKSTQKKESFLQPDAHNNNKMQHRSLFQTISHDQMND